MTGAGRSGRRGGSGTVGGVSYQSRVAAYYAVAILAEAEAPAPWGWPQGSTLESVHLETGELVDDLAIVNSHNARAYLQAKLRVTLGTGVDSDFAKAIRAFVIQYLGSGGRGLGEDDRLVFAVGPRSSAPIRTHLPMICERARGGISLEGLAVNKAEREVLDTLLDHLRPAWREVAGGEPGDAEVTALLAAIYVSVLDLGEDGEAEKLAQVQLRSSVLADRERAGSAWDRLLAIADDFGEVGSGADRHRLQRLLASREIDVLAAPSYREDIDHLRSYSAARINELKDLAAISVTAGELKLERRLSAEIAAASALAGLLVTGDPGFGKSASIYEFLDELPDGVDVLVIPAEGPAAGSLGQLREELRLEHEIVDVLDNWPGSEPAYLVIDGLDAARGEGPRKALLDLIDAVAREEGRWRVLASVRRFELRYNSRLRELFPANAEGAVPGVHTDPEFAGVRHFVVPVLSDSELEQLKELAPALHALLARAPGDLRDLARVPFNLRLLAELLDAEVDGNELEPVSTQVELLDLYWERRLLDGEGGDLRSAAVATVVEEMVDRRRLQADRGEVLSAELASALAELLEENVIAEHVEPDGQVEREVLAFSHNVIFDYALSRVMLRGTDQRLVDAVRERPDLVVFARPSFDFHFRHLWQADGTRVRFWEGCLALAGADGVAQIARVIGPAVAAELLEDVADLEPLVGALTDADPGRRQAAEAILRHMVAAGVGLEPKAYLRDPARKLAWAGLAVALAELDLSGSVIAPLQRLVRALSADYRSLTTQELAALGLAARRMLAHALEREVPDRALSWPGIEAVARTYETDPAASRALLAQIIKRERLEHFGYLELPDLADQAELLAERDPAFLRDVYAAAFGFEETSREVTDMGGGAILSLSSNRAQDYGHAHYVLGEEFPGFLEAAPSEALDALIAVRVSYAEKRASRSAGKLRTFVGPSGSELRVLTDGGPAWDSEPLGHDAEVKILDAFEERLDSLAAAEDAERIEKILAELSSREAPAAIWRRVLLAAARSPELLGPAVEPLLADPSALEDSLLGPPIGEYLRAAFASLDPVLCGEIEGAILSLPERAEAEMPDFRDAREVGDHRRDRLLGCLDPAELSEPAARERLEEMRAADEVPANQEDVIFSGWRNSEYGERESLAEAGVDLEIEVNGQLFGLREPVEVFVVDHLNGVPPAEEVEATLPAIEALWHGLQEPGIQEADAQLRQRSATTLAQAAEVVARDAERACDDPARRLALEILLASASHEEPVVEPGSEASFDESASWSASPRIEAAEGLPALARDANCTEPGLIDAVTALSADAAPEVRFLVAGRLGMLRDSAPVESLAIAERMVSEESSTAVLGAVVRALPHLIQGEPDRLRRMIEPVFERSGGDGEGTEQLRLICASLLSDLYVNLGDREAEALLDREILADPASHHKLVRQLLGRLRNTLVYGEPGDRKAAEIRGRAIGIFEQVLERAIGQFEAAKAELEGVEADEEDERVKRGRGAAQAIDGVGDELFFASGAFRHAQGEPRTSVEQRGRLYREGAGIIDLLSKVELPAVTHHLVETLQACIEEDPRGVFVRVAAAVKSGSAGGYHFEPMAEGLVVSIVDRYLAEYVSLLQGDQELRELLVDLLDAFVEAGWPNALRLTYGLHEAFR